MTDLQNMIIMLAKSEDTFEKAKSGNDWVLILKGVKFYFNTDGKNFILILMVVIDFVEKANKKGLWRSG